MTEAPEFTNPRLLRPKAEDEEGRAERSLRPQSFDEYLGQSQAKQNLKMFIQAARERGDALDHALLIGPPGLGKTTLAHLIAREMGTQLHAISGPNLERKGDLAALLTNLKAGDVLFVDEVHRLYRPIEEVLYSAMEDFRLDVVMGQGPQARTISLDIEPFTLVGATTRAGLLSTPLRDRFGVTLRLEFYSPAELSQILLRSAGIIKVELSPTGADELACRSRGTPRIANRLLRRVRDYAQVKAKTHVIDREIARAALQTLEVDERGLDAMDRRILRTLIEKFDGGPAGVETLSFALGENRETIEDVYEPYLIQEGFLQRTPRGRIAGRRAFEHLGLPIPVTLASAWAEAEGTAGTGNA